MGMKSLVVKGMLVKVIGGGLGFSVLHAIIFWVSYFQCGGSHDSLKGIWQGITKSGSVWASLVKWLGFPGGLTKKMKERLDGLRGFRIKRHPRYNLPVRRIEAIEDFTQKRIREICEYGAKADDFLSIQADECTVNRAQDSVQCTHNSDSLSEQIKQNMRADPFITKMELADLLQISPRWVARKMKDLQASGEIRRVGADKNGHWEVVG